MNHNQSEASFEAELRDVFLNEAEEMLDETEQAFIQVEENPQDVDKIDKIFRLVHTIKGSAHVAGFRQLGNFAHCFEGLLGELREKRLDVNGEIIDVLLASNDRFRLFVGELRLNSNAIVEVADLEKRIRAAMPAKDGSVGGIKADAALLTKAPAKSALTTGLVSGSEPKLSDVDFSNENLAGAPATAKVTVLICDDEPDLLALLAEQLEESGYGVIACSSALEGLQAMEKFSDIGIVLTDFSMPGMDGIQFVRRIRSFNRFIPVVIISGHSSRNQFKEYLEIGVDEFIDKPFTSDGLLIVMRRVEKAHALQKSLLEMARLTFRAFVSLEKMEYAIFGGNSNPKAEGERATFTEVLGEMRNLTVKLLDAERANNRMHG